MCNTPSTNNDFLGIRSSISANALYLEAEAYEGSDRLAKTVAGGPEIIGSVYIHPSAHVDPSAKVCHINIKQKNLK